MGLNAKHPGVTYTAIMGSNPKHPGVTNGARVLT